MKNLILVVILVLLQGYAFSQNLTISIKVDTCIDARYSNNVSYIIENHGNSDLWIKTEYLNMYFGVYSSSGEMVQRKTTRHNNEINVDEYTKIEKNSQVVVTWKADFFDNIKFELGQEYYIEAGYEYLHPNRDEKKRSRRSDFVLIQSRIDAKSNRFRICAL